MRTAAEQAAVRLAVEAARQLSGTEIQANTRNGFFFFTPEVTIETGDADAFSAVIAKLTGSLVFFKTTTIDGIRTPNTAFLHTLPMSLGVEMSGSFENVNLLGEIGYVPWFQGSVPGQLKTLYLGVFIQGGYKAHVDSSTNGASSPSSGSTDQSGESANSALFRAKASIRFSPEIVLSKARGYGVGVVGTWDGWYDMANGEFYKRLQATFRIRIDKDRYFDMSYEKGSGAPNFNKGEQFSTNLTMRF